MTTLTLRFSQHLTPKLHILQVRKYFFPPKTTVLSGPRDFHFFVTPVEPQLSLPFFLFNNPLALSDWRDRQGYHILHTGAPAILTL